ncbi:MAG: hypothetical protein KFF50_14880 [Desulfatitalea sp.]|nr:hypothetical protein [Desulfatitalea sp.]
MEEEGDSSDQKGGVDTPHADKDSDNGGDGGIAAKLSRLLPAGRWEGISQQLTRLHGHPIAVHIPNGLLPISVFFTIMALLFGSAGFATAARLNTIMVALAMPVVIGTGWVDWINRFGGRMSPVFRMKMICAGLVTGLSFILAIWWTVNPTLYLNGISGNLIFVLFNLVNLGAASVAGWYGGKLVFNK